jgi:hypothetical protein
MQVERSGCLCQDYDSRLANVLRYRLPPDTATSQQSGQEESQQRRNFHRPIDKCASPGSASARFSSIDIPLMSILSVCTTARFNNHKMLLSQSHAAAGTTVISFCLCIIACCVVSALFVNRDLSGKPRQKIRCPSLKLTENRVQYPRPLRLPRSSDQGRVVP